MIPSEVRKITSIAFSDCPNVTEIIIHEDVEEIETYAFNNCQSLLNITVSEQSRTFFSLEGILYERTRKKLVCCPQRKCSVVIPEGVRSIETRAFADCKVLKRVRFPESIEIIESNAFNSCIGLKEIVLPEHLRYLGSQAFFNCVKLEKIVIPSGLQQIKRHAFTLTPWLTARRKENPFVIVNHILIERTIWKEHIDIPEGVKIIGQMAFCSISVLKSVSLPETVTHIEDFAFHHCYNLKEISLPDKIESIGAHAFGQNENQEIEFSYRNVTFSLSWDKDSLEKIVKMIQTKNFHDEEIGTVTKCKVIWGMYDSIPNDVDVLAYLKENFRGMFRYVINEKRVETVRKVLDSGQFINKDNVDEFILYAIDKQSTEIQVMLINYKAKYIGYEDTEELIRRKFEL